MRHTERCCLGLLRRLLMMLSSLVAVLARLVGMLASLVTMLMRLVTEPRRRKSLFLFHNLSLIS